MYLLVMIYSGFKSVYVGEWLSDGWLVAIKVIDDKVNAEVALSEIENLKNCNFEFIVNYKDGYKKNHTFWVLFFKLFLYLDCDGILPL